MKFIKVKKACENENMEECEPVSPTGKIFFNPSFNCYVICLFGCKEKIDIEVLKRNVENSPLFRHRRFCSIVKEDKRGRLRWVPTTTSIDNHLVVPDIDPEFNYPLDFCEDYAAKLATAPPLDPSLPLWQLHVLNVNSSEAAATMILKVHHSLGDGISLISLCFACSTKALDPNSLPTIPDLTARKKSKNPRGFAKLFKGLKKNVLIMRYTFIDFKQGVLTVLNCMKDSDTPIRGYPGIEYTPKRLAHITLSLEDVKTIKNVIKGTVNDVILGTVTAGLVRYLDRIYAQRGEAMPSDLLVRLIAPFNLRKAPGIQELAAMDDKNRRVRWGNDIGYSNIPLPMIKYDHPLEYAKACSAICKGKKLSFGVKLSSFVTQLPGKVPARMFYNIVSNTTMTFSNTASSADEVALWGQRITYIAPTTTGQPQGLAVYFMSYMGNVNLVVTTAEELAPDPKQLCLDCYQALTDMKKEAIATRNGYSTGDPKLRN